MTAPPIAVVRALPLLGVLGLYTVIFLEVDCGTGCGEIRFESWQLLDRNLLQAHLLDSLLLLHAQPPVLNLLLGLALKVAALLDVAPETITRGIMWLCGATTLVLARSLALRLTGHARFAILVALAVLASASFWMLNSVFFYDGLLAPILLASLVAATDYLRRGALRALALALAIAVVITLTRTLYPTIWTLAFGGLLLLGRLWVARHIPGSALGLVAVFVLLGLAWPAKNLVVFGHFTSSSWDGFNLSRGHVPMPGELTDYLVDGSVADDPRAPFTRIGVETNPALGVLTNPLKEDGSRNWNHFVLLTTRRESLRAAVDTRWQHPHRTFAMAREFYHRWNQPPYSPPWSASPSERDTYARPLWIYDSLFFHDLRPLLDGSPIDESRFYYRITIYGLFLFPLILLGTVAMGVAVARQQSRQDAAVLFIGLAVALWPMVVTCLTDGLEGHRISTSSQPLVVVLACWAARYWVLRCGLWPHVKPR